MQHFETPKKPKTSVFWVKVDTELKNAFKAYSCRKGTTMRRLITKYMERAVRKEIEEEMDKNAV